MKGVLIIGGEAPSLETVRHEIVNAEIIICADSGFDTALDMGLAPDIIIGDMDSIRNKTRLNELSENKVLRYSEYKDETDTELGIKYLRDNSFDEIIKDIATAAVPQINEFFKLKDSPLNNCSFNSAENHISSETHPSLGVHESAMETHPSLGVHESAMPNNMMPGELNYNC